MFGKGSEVQDRDFDGLPTFTLRHDAPSNTLVWANFVDGKDLVLGHSVVAGKVTDKRFTFMDWTTARLEYTTDLQGKPIHNTVFFSRAFPGALYDTESPKWDFEAGDLAFDRAAYQTTQGKFAVVNGSTQIGAMGAPWIVVWNHSQSGSEIVPVLIRFERKPTALSFQNGIHATFGRPAKSILVMPLYGVHRPKPQKAGEWDSAIPADAISQAGFWTRVSAAMPIGINESYEAEEATGLVRITDRIQIRDFHDEWGTKPLVVTPVSPVTEIAHENGYPVRWGSKVVRTPLATLVGPFAYAEGAEFSYEIPIPSARDTMLAPLLVTGDPQREAYRLKAQDLALHHEPKPDDTSDGGLGLQLKEYSQAFPLLDADAQATLRPRLQRAFDASFAPGNMQTVTDPVVGQTYVMCNKIWCAGEAYDREWYAGRQLDMASEYSTWVDPGAVRSHWKAIQGLYAYYRVYNDWAWSGTLSSVFAYALCADGMNFAMEGMLGVARMAKRMGDDELWRDATYRSAKQALCTYGAWFLTEWVKQQDYVTWTDTSYDYAKKSGRYEIHRMAPADAQTGFGLDIFSDTTGVKVFRNGSFWHATAAIYWNNPCLYRLYDETLYGKIYDWEYRQLPRLHPSWLDKSAIERFSNQPYGSNFVIAHLDARANLFGDSPDALAPLMDKLQPDIAFLYWLRAAIDLEQAGAPQVWVPEAQAKIESVGWDAKGRTLSVSLTPLASETVCLDWSWRRAESHRDSPQAGPPPTRILVNGMEQRAQRIKGGFWRLKIVPVVGESSGHSLHVTIEY